MSTPILIAGATGTNGRALIAELTRRGAPVRALVRDPAKAADLAGDAVELVQGDLADRASLDTAMQGVETAYVVTAVSQDAVAWFANFFAAAEAAGVKRIVKFSGLGAGADSESEIIRQHAQSDRALIDLAGASATLSYTILQPNSFHQNMLWQADSIRGTGQFYLPLADARQSTIDVRDIAEVTAKVLLEPGHENKIYRLTGPESLSFADVAAILSDVAGKPVSYVAIPVGAAEQAMAEMGMPAWHAHALAGIQGVFATGEYAEVEPDLERLLGRPGRTFRQFAEDHRAAYAG